MTSITDLVSKHRPDLEPLKDLYRHFHRNPELSDQELETSAAIVERIEALKADFDIKSNIGGYGVAAVLCNGEGPSVLLRADFDALPIEERTGLDYASTKRMKDSAGIEKPVSHACGHDMHTTALIGAAELLASCRDDWSGTLILIFQPAEEQGTGAQAMVDDGLYEKHGVPKPDVVLAGHVLPMRTGIIGTRPGLIANSADSMHITLHGQGAHASMPDKSIDPIVMAASLITKLQTIVSREMDPHDTNVVTVASIHAGDSDNVICDDAKLALDVRNASPASRKHVLASIDRIVKLESQAGRAVKEPTIEFTRSYPVTTNDPAVTEMISNSFAAHFGEAFDPDIAQCGASEDFSNLATAIDRPYCESYLRPSVLGYGRLSSTLLQLLSRILQRLWSY